MGTLYIVLHECEGGLVELLLGVLRQQRAALAAQTRHADDHQTAMLLTELEQLQGFGDAQFQIVPLVDDLQQAALLRLGGDDDAVLGEQTLEVGGGDLLAGDGALADAGEHGIGQVQADINLLTGGGITHVRTSCIAKLVFLRPRRPLLFCCQHTTTRCK